VSAFERHGTRDLAFSRWHRQALPATCGMIDIDCLEYCARCRTPLFLVETAQDVGQALKVTTVLENHARSANLPAYCVLYAKTDETCPSDRRCRDDRCAHGIRAFRVRQVSPTKSDWQARTPAEFAQFVMQFHRAHDEIVCRASWLGGAA